ncbi:MAG: lycopene cyclase family protein, partial [Bacteroidota bacterium]
KFVFENKSHPINSTLQAISMRVMLKICVLLSMSKYDYIIAGAGASGLLLADALGSDSFFASKSILLIDKDLKQQNDRTWCFWEVGPGQFDEIAHKIWPNIYFAGKTLRLDTNIAPYRYKLVRGLDFYDHYRNKLSALSNITWVTENIESIQETEEGVAVKTTHESYEASTVFSSLFDYQSILNQKKYPVLQQHFVGWFVRLDQAVLDDQTARFMDFSVPQKGNTRFMYLLPFSQTEALFEYTLFSAEPLERSEYEDAIKEYLQEHFPNVNYEITETEQGNIPMSCFPFEKWNTNKVVGIGIAGGWAKPSTGFTFYNSSRKVQELVKYLKTGKPLSKFHRNDKFRFYDMLLLDVLARDNSLGQSIFESLFRKRKVPLILKFLDNRTSFGEDILMMSAPSPFPFLRALFGRIF